MTDQQPDIVQRLSSRPATTPADQSLLADAADTITALRAELSRLQAGGQGVVRFRKTEVALPDLVDFSSSYGGQWSSKRCIGVDRGGLVGAATLKVRGDVKALIDAGQHVPRVRGYIDFRVSGSEQWDATPVAWAYADDISAATTEPSTALPAQPPAAPALVPMDEEVMRNAERWCTLRDSLHPVNKSHTDMPMVTTRFYQHDATYTCEGLVRAVDAIIEERARNGLTVGDGGAGFNGWIEVKGSEPVRLQWDEEKGQS